MFFLDYTNQSLAYIVDAVQIVVLLALCLTFVFRRKENVVFMKVYSFMLAYLCGMAGIKFMFDIVSHSDEWYKPYIASSLCLVPVIEGLMYSLYRQGASFGKVLRRIIINESPFLIIIILTVTVGYHKWYKTAAYTYLGVFSIYAFIVTLVRIRLFSRQVRQAYADADERGLMWIRPILVMAAVLLMTFAVSYFFVFAWVRIAFDAVSVFVYAGVGYYLMRQKPVDNSLVDDTRMYLQGDMVDKVQVRVRDKNGDMSHYAITKIVRMYPVKAGSSSCCHTIENRELLEICRNVLEKLEWVGMADFDVLQRLDTKEYKIIEINPRVPASLRAAYVSGINFPKLIVNDTMGIRTNKQVYKPGMTLRYMGIDLLWLMKSPKRFRKILSWLHFFGRKVFYQDIIWSDPSTWYSWLVVGIKKIRRRNMVYRVNNKPQYT